MDMLTIFTAAASTLSGAWAVSSYKGVKFSVWDLVAGREDVVLLAFIVTTTGISAWHTAMMTIWAMQPSVASTSYAFVLEIGLWNIGASLAFIFAHAIAKFSARPENHKRLEQIYLWGGQRQCEERWTQPRAY